MDTELVETNAVTRAKKVKVEKREMLCLDAAQVHDLAEAIAPEFRT